MLCDESSLSLEASGNKTCRINENFSVSIQGKCVDVLPHTVECVGNVIRVQQLGHSFSLLGTLWCADNTCINPARNETCVSGTKLYGQD